MRFTSCQRFAWSAMCLWGACAVLGSCSKDLTTINMSEPAAAKPAGKKEDLRPVLKVAIGALVSPEPTRELYYDLVTLIGSRAGMRAAFAQRRTYAEVNHLLATEKADIAFVCSGPYVRGHDEFGLSLLAVPVVAGKTTYHSHIMVNKIMSITRYEPREYLKGVTIVDIDKSSGPPEQ